MDTTFTANIYVPLDMALRGNYPRFGCVPVAIDLAVLDPANKELLISWGRWDTGPLGDAVLTGTKREWGDAGSARRGICHWKRLEASTVPPTAADVWRALVSRRDREPQEMEFEKIAEERRRYEEKGEEKPSKRRWWRFWSAAA